MAGDNDDVLSLFDPAFTFENLLANGDPTLKQPATTRKDKDCSGSMDDSTRPNSHSEDFWVQDFALKPGSYPSATKPGVEPSSDFHLLEDHDQSKQRARATQARFRLREKVCPLLPATASIRQTLLKGFNAFVGSKSARLCHSLQDLAFLKMTVQSQERRRTNESKLRELEQQLQQVR